MWQIPRMRLVPFVFSLMWLFYRQIKTVKSSEEHINTASRLTY